MSFLEHKTIWITGASSGIGKALAIEMSKKNNNIILSSRNINDLESVAKLCKGNTLVLPIDLEKQDNFVNKVKKAIDLFGKIDILINNGGISQRSTASETSIDVDRRLMEINYFGTVVLTKSILPYMQKQKSGHIVTVSSLSGKFGFFLRSAYAASKFAQLGFFESLRLEEEKNNIKVSIVFPGFVNTNISQNALSGEGKKHDQHDENQKKGISPMNCAKDIIKGIKENKHEIYSGGKEIWMVKIRRLLPGLFYRILRNQSGT